MNVRLLSRTVSTLALFVVLISSLHAGNISGHVTTDTTWAVASSPVIITGTVTVNTGVSLTIEAGVTVKFDPGTQLIVAGSLIADGTSDSLIAFTSNAVTPSAGDWNGIEFQNSANVGAVFDYCIVEYAGSGANSANIFYKTGAYSIALTNCTIRYSLNHGVNVRASSPRIAHSVFSDNAGYGIFTDLSLGYIVDTCLAIRNVSGGIRVAVNATTTITGCVIDSNGTGIFIDASARPTIQYNTFRANDIGIQFTSVGSSQPTIKDNVIMTNATYGFKNTGTSLVEAEYNYWGSELGPYNADYNPSGTGNDVSNYVDFHPWNLAAGTYPVINVTANITVNTTWSSNTVYWLKTNITVTSGDTLTIQPGAVIKFAPTFSLTISGAIIANGTSDSVIVFTSDKDDSYGGDINGDGRATDPAPGDWETVSLSGGGNNASVLNYCVFKFGGYRYTYSEVNINNCSPSLSNLFVTNSSNTGMSLTNSWSNLSNCSISGNGTNGLYLYNTNTAVTDCKLEGNGNNGLQAVGTSHFTVQRSLFSRNGNYGIHSDGGGSRATLLLLDSCTVTQNEGIGVYSWNGNASQVFSNSFFDGNDETGLFCYNSDSLVTIYNNTTSNNGHEGFVTSKGILTDNVIVNNRYPIGLVGRCGTRYSGNTITDNDYNRAIALRCNREQLSDTLFAEFPEGMTSKTYVMIENSTSITTSSGSTLVIEPGVIVKFANGLNWYIQGRLIADGNDPIVFTSYRDTLYGGKTNLLTDNVPPARGDWSYVQFATAGTNSSIINNCIFQYASNGLRFGGVSFVTPITNSIVRKSNSHGIYIDGNSVLTFEGCTIDSGNSMGIYAGYYSSDDITLRGSTVQDNGGEGLRCTHQAAFREVSNCIIRRNNGWGIQIDDARIPQTFLGNTINNNVTGAVSNINTVYTANGVMFIGNMITNHTGDGVVSSSARYIDNTIQYNRFPIGLWRRAGNSYVDNNGIDGNIISNNSYNAIAIYSGNIKGNLLNVFPTTISSNVYVVIYNFDLASSDTLTIDPGTKIKFDMLNGYHSFTANGVLLAEGTAAQPIIWTSWRDNSIGGKTSLLTDSLNPSPGDWNYVAYTNSNSKVRHNIFKYGGRDGAQAVHFGNNCSGITFSNNLIRKSSSAGIILTTNNTTTIDSTMIDSCSTYGIRAYGYSTINLTVRNVIIRNNGNHGIYVENTAKISTVNNCVIENNGGTGVYVVGSAVPLWMTTNTINNNGGHGIYAVNRDDLIDTLIFLSGNTIRNNALVGILSSRAYIVNDSITGNKFPVGVTGLLNLALTGNVHGNVYENNYISGNTYNGIVSLEGNILGRIGGTYPDGFTSNVIAVRGDATVSAGNTIVIAPGTILKFTRETGNGLFQVDGRLLSEGTEIYKNVFTSWKDDSYGGDSNGDSTATVPGPSDWDKIYLSAGYSDSSHILNTIVRYGGRGGNGNIYILNNKCPVDSSYISYSSNLGMYLQNSQSAVTANEIHSNNEGIRISGANTPLIRYNNVRDNTLYGLYNNTASTTDAKYNYWGAASGPYVNQGADQNLTGTGNRIFIPNGVVQYRPFLTSRSGILLGDPSFNGSITAYDAALTLQHVVSIITFSASQQTAANVSGDGTVSAYDASLILRFVVGSITGFPGSGKISLDPGSITAYNFITEKEEDNRINVVLRLKNAEGIYASDFKMTYNVNDVEPVDVLKTDASKNMTMYHRAEEGTVGVALAGTTPVASEQDIVKLVFRLKDAAKEKAMVKFTLEQFLVNELEVSSSVKEIVHHVNGLPTVFALKQNYPNPFNPLTVISYELPVESRVTLKVFDMLGQEVTTLVDEMQEAGYYTSQWDGTCTTGYQLASGIYFYRIEAYGKTKQVFSMVKKMSLIR